MTLKFFIRKCSFYNKPVDKKFLVGADIEKAASSIIRAGSERLVVGEVSNSVDIGLVAGEGAAHFRVPRVPDLGKRIAATGDEDVVLERRAADPHHVTVVVLELLA